MKLPVQTKEHLIRIFPLKITFKIRRQPTSDRPDYAEHLSKAKLLTLNVAFRTSGFCSSVSISGKHNQS